jgi:predicted TIM-barrel fold metal-dependent hydrolase
MTATSANQVLISADSHVMEPHDLWSKALASRFGERAPSFAPPVVGQGAQAHPGGADPHERIKEMSVDGVSAEVLYTTLGLGLYSIEEPALQQAAFGVFNDWLIDYCSAAPDRLVGVAMVSCYDIDQAVAEVQRVRTAGLGGVQIWQVPPAELPFQSQHYDKLWDALEETQMPLSLHILTGFSYHSRPRLGGVENYRGPVNLKLLDAANALFDFLHYGILEKHPDLKLVIVENEIGWLPFLLQQWDYYFQRFGVSNPIDIEHEPSFYFYRQVFATFFNDVAGGHNLSWWGQDNCMWSNDFPHPNSTWPNSRRVIERDLGGLPDHVQAKLVRENCVGLYNLRVPTTA